jgi:uncharacterized protein
MEKCHLILLCLNRFKGLFALLFFLIFASHGGFSQERSLVNTIKSAWAKLRGPDMDAVRWTGGFWAERFEICQSAMVPNIWHTYSSPDISHAFRNFEIAAGLETGDFSGPPFHDGDTYKVLEAMASTYAITKDPRLDSIMDRVIAVIGKVQRKDGYIHTPVIIEQNKTGANIEFRERLNFESYNLGHLMTAACIHFRATGKSSFLQIAIKAADYLYRFYERSSPELARNAICPSHYMGVVEMYRTTKNPKYLELAKNLIDIRGMVEDGTDDNQDRIPFRQQTKAMGHAVRANYLYAGVADVFAETGDTSLLRVLNLIWDDVVRHKLYITGGCGALYDGVSPDGTSYKPAEIQKIHQAYGRDYQLPSITAYNESCANIGNLLWNYRMFLTTGEAKYADVMEQGLYNSIPAGVSLDGKRFFYTNPLRVDFDFPYTMRWKKEREEYIALSNCCPPNTVRTLAETACYAYSLSEKGVWVNLYGSNLLSTTLPDGNIVQISQETNYPWEGNIKIRIEKSSSKNFSLFLRIPGWCDKAEILINRKKADTGAVPGAFAEINRTWSEGDLIELELPMKVRLLESNPLVEETRNQVAVQRGPVVYCLESNDLPTDIRVAEIMIPEDIRLKPVEISIEGSKTLALEGVALSAKRDWKNKLYQEIPVSKLKKVPIRLIPYYAWGNRGKSEMTVWMPLCRLL